MLANRLVQGKEVGPSGQQSLTGYLQGSGCCKVSMGLADHNHIYN